MTKLVIYHQRCDILGKIRVRAFRTKWIAAHPLVPQPLLFDDGNKTCVGYEFDSEEAAALFKLTYL